MSHLKRKYCISFSLGLFSVAIAFVTPLSNGINRGNITITPGGLRIDVVSQGEAIAQTNQQSQPKKPKRPKKPKTPKNSDIIKRFVDSVWKRRPKTTLGSRSDICSIAPGLIDTYTVWHNRPLFLWYSTSKSQKAELIVRERESEEIVWVKTVNSADKYVIYNGKQSLESGKSYQWRLKSINPDRGTSLTPWTTFQIMSTKQRAQIQADLQGLEQKSGIVNTSEEIAIKKAEYFFDYQADSERNNNLWSDGLQALYQVKKPSASFVKKREQFVTNICTPNS